MTVAELIEKLREMPQDSTVMLLKNDHCQGELEEVNAYQSNPFRDGSRWLVDLS